MHYKFEENFNHHAPEEGQAQMYEAVRATLKDVAYFLDEICPDSREKSTAFTKLEEAMFWANASIARTGHVVDVQVQEPVMVDEEDVIKSIVEQTDIDAAIVADVLNAESVYLAELGIIAKEGE